MDTEKTLVLDVSGKDKAAISVMHAYLRARGVEPEPDCVDKAQELANNPDNSRETACLRPDREGGFARTVMDAYWGRTTFDVAAVIIRLKDEGE